MNANKGKNSIKIGLIDGNQDTSAKINPNVKLVNDKAEKGAKEEVVVKPAILMSVVDHPVKVKYGDDVIRFTGRAKEKISNWELLENPLPTGLKLKKL